MPIMKRDEHSDMDVDTRQNYLQTNKTKVGLLLLVSDMHTNTLTLQ